MEEELVVFQTMNYHLPSNIFYFVEYVECFLVFFCGVCIRDGSRDADATLRPLDWEIAEHFNGPLLTPGVATRTTLRKKKTGGRKGDI